MSLTKMPDLVQTAQPPEVHGQVQSARPRQGSLSLTKKGNCQNTPEPSRMYYVGSLECAVLSQEARGGLIGGARSKGKSRVTTTGTTTGSGSRNTGMGRIDLVA